MDFYQSTLPTYLRSYDYLKLYRNGSLFIVDDYLGERKNFIVVDGNSIRANHPTIQTAFQNGWVVEIGSASSPQNVYVWRLNTDDINSFQNICLHRDILKRKENVKVIIGGSTFDDWNFLDRRFYKGSAGSFYTQHIEFPNGYPSNQEMIIIYTEKIDTGIGRAIARLDRSFSGLSNPKKVTLSIVDSGANHYYLDDAVISDGHFTCTCTYKDIGGVQSDIIVHKHYQNQVYLKNFKKGVSLSANGYRLEIWMKSNRSGQYKGSSDYSPIADTFPIIYDMKNENLLDLSNDNYRKRYQGQEFVLRVLNTTDWTVSEFSRPVKVHKQTVFTTDSSFASRDCKGFVLAPKVK